MNSELWLHEHSGAKRFLTALGIALLLEIGVFGLLLPMMASSPPPPADKQSVVKLSIMAPSPPAPPAPPPPKPLPPPPKPVTPPPPPPPMPVTPPKPLPPPMPVAHHVFTHHIPPPRHIKPPPVPAPPQAVQQPAPPTPPPPASIPAAPSAGELDLFQSEMREAVQDAAITPSAAELSHESGIVRVSFTFEDGVVSNISVIGSSGFPMLDDAAVEAVRDARYPQEPADFAGHPHQVVVDVIFRAEATSVDSD